MNIFLFLLHFNLNSIKTYYITIDTYLNDVIEIKNVQLSQDKYHSSLTNLITKINDESLEHPIWMEHKFFFDSCTNTTLLILENKIQENYAKTNNIIPTNINNLDASFIQVSFLTKSFLFIFSIRASPLYDYYIINTQ